MASTGNRIAERRKAQGLSRNQLAKRLKTSYLRVYRIEKGTTPLKTTDLAKWAKALGCESAELIA